ncbi:MAG: hypothetical protein RLZZ262_2313 [Bacteroidota bacterium]|jgi:UDP-GlcNAc:undecaprenyl-phosphate/decaprenyl-phosphate GlcNAc-1-phosphate transferase
MDDVLLTYGLLLATVIAAGALLVLRARGITSTAKSIDNAQRWAPAKPASGGLLFALSLVLGQWLIAPLSLWANVALAAGFAIGLCDDLLRIRPYSKLAGQALAAIAVGVYVANFDQHVFWILAFAFSAVVMMNSINMLDNMDGVATLGSLPFGLVSALLFLTGNLTSPIGVLLVTGSLSFLLYNAYPSKMFMGDSGSMLLGVAASLVMFEIGMENPDLSWKILPIWLFVSTLTVADTLLVVIRRKQHGKSPMQGGKDHSTHHLVYFGWSQTKVTYVFLAMAIIQSLIAFFVIVLELYTAIVLAAMLLYVVLWVFFVWRVSQRNLKSGIFDYTSH